MRAEEGMGRMTMLTPPEQAYLARMPQMLPTYTRLRAELTDAYPDMTVRVGRTQVTFCTRHVFAMASLPWRRVSRWPAAYLLVSFGLGARLPEPRIVQAVQPYPGRWTHHVLVTAPEQIDGQLLDWIDQAYRFALTKR